MAATEARSGPIVVCDAGPLIHLDELGCLDLLADFGEIWVPETVWREVALHRPRVFADPSVAFLRVTAKQAESPELRALARALTLHAGESEAIRIALENSGGLLLTDDAAARIAAAGLGLPVHGSIGVIVRSIRRGLRSKQEVLVVLRNLPVRSTLHLKRSLLDGIISDVENS